MTRSLSLAHGGDPCTAVESDHEECNCCLALRTGSILTAQQDPPSSFHHARWIPSSSLGLMMPGSDS